MRITGRWIDEEARSAAMRYVQRWKSANGTHPSVFKPGLRLVGPVMHVNRRRSRRARLYTWVFTLVPVLASDCTPPACTCCNRLLRKFCNPELAGEADPDAAAPLTPVIKF